MSDTCSTCRFWHRAFETLKKWTQAGETIETAAVRANLAVKREIRRIRDLSERVA